MKTFYASEGRVEEIEVPAGGKLPGDFRIARSTFTFKGEEGDEHPCLNVWKGDVRLASVFWNESIGEVCVYRFETKVCWRMQTLSLIANVVVNWERLLGEIEDGFMFTVPERAVQEVVKGGGR
jgi:hypothetical protein